MGGYVRISSYLQTELGKSDSTVYVSAGNMLFPQKSLQPYQLPQARYIASWFLSNFQGKILHLTGRERALLTNTDSIPASYQVLSSVQGTGSPEMIVKIGTRKIGFVSLDTGSLTNMSEPDFQRRWAQAVSERVSALLSRETPWAVVGLSGMGLEVDRLIAPYLPDVDLILGQHSEKMAIRTEHTGDKLLLHLTTSGKHLGRIDLEMTKPMNNTLNLTVFEDKTDRQKIMDDNERLAKKIDVQKKIGSESAQKVIRLLEKRRDRNRKKLEGMNTAASPFSYLHREVPLDDSIPALPAAESLVVNAKMQINEINRTAPENLIVPKEKILFAGWAACMECHPSQYRFVKTQKHAIAWETLVKGKRDADLDCIWCHSAAFGEPGGIFHVRQLDRFQDVQCESCHGPGKAHMEDPENRPFPKVTEDACLKCHTKEHSDEVIDANMMERMHCPPQN
jgi:Cytochrome c554 and c-prime